VHDVIGFLKDAVERGADIGIRGCYVIKDGAISANNINKGLQAGVTMDYDGGFNVPADAMDLALARMKDVQEIKLNDDHTLTVRSGRLSSTIQCNPDEPVGVPNFPDEWIDCPPGLADALKLALPFIGEMGWSSGIRLMDERVTAISNNYGIDIILEGLALDEPVLLTKDVAEFITKQGTPDRYSVTENNMFWQWDDGRWLRSQFLNDKMPEDIVDRIFNTASQDKAPVAIDEAFREAYADAAGLTTTGILRITPTGFDTKDDKLHATSHVGLDIKGVPQSHVSYWDTKVIDAAMGCATSWNPAAYPQPSLFKGDGFRGVVMGRSRW